MSHHSLPFLADGFHMQRAVPCYLSMVRYSCLLPTLLAARARHTYSIEFVLQLGLKGVVLSMDGNDSALYQQREGFWGKPSATIDWCEENYELSHYIAEFWNTVSNITFVVLALYGYRRARQERFERRFLAQYVAVLVTGIGSALFHGTLRYL